MNPSDDDPPRGNAMVLVRLPNSSNLTQMNNYTLEVARTAGAKT